MQRAYSTPESPKHTAITALVAGDDDDEGTEDQIKQHLKDQVNICLSKISNDVSGTFNCFCRMLAQMRRKTPL